MPDNSSGVHFGYFLKIISNLYRFIVQVVIIVTSPLSVKFGTYRMLMASYVLTWLNSAIGLILGSLVSYDFIVGTILMDRYGAYKSQVVL